MAAAARPRNPVQGVEGHHEVELAVEGHRQRARIGLNKLDRRGRWATAARTTVTGVRGGRRVVDHSRGQITSNDAAEATRGGGPRAQPVEHEARRGPVAATHVEDV